LLDGSRKPHTHCVKGKMRGCRAISHAHVFVLGRLMGKQ
jgi:hypothetical protein